MQNQAKITLKEVRQMKPTKGESVEVFEDRFFGYFDLKKVLEKEIEDMKVVIEEKILEDYVDNRYKDDIVELQEAFQEGEFTEEELAEEIGKLMMQARNEMEETFKDEETGITARYKTRTTIDWEPQINEVFEDYGVLHLVKRVSSDLAKRMDLSSFTQENLDKYIKIYENVNLNKEEKAAKKEIQNEMRNYRKKEMQLLELDELLHQFKIAKQKQTMLNDYFEEDKETFMSMMKMSGDEVITNQGYLERLQAKGEDISQLDVKKITLAEPHKEYDNEKILQGEFQLEVFLFAKYDDMEDKLTVFEYASNEVYEIKDKPVYILGLECENDKGELIVDGRILSQFNHISEIEKRVTAKLKKCQAEYIDDQKGYGIFDEITITGQQLLAAGKVVNSKIKELIENGNLSYSDIRDFKVIKGTSVYFEIIEEEKDEARRNVFEMKRNNVIQKQIEREAEYNQFLQELSNVD